MENSAQTTGLISLGIRERTEAREEGLSPYAQRCAHSRGRASPEAPDPIRSIFQRDRDRIIHTNAFRRLKHKTQVFIAPLGDHFVTRLTHTLEVAQLARTIARALNLNEDLVEAISLGHDLGHTPFGHTGEEALEELCQGGFRHNEQSLRVVDILEKNGCGLNLSWEVRDGILNHSKSEASIFGPGLSEAATYEAEVVKITDAIAYINHDIGDAIRAGMLTESDLPEEITAVLGCSPSARINAMVSDIIAYSWPVSGQAKTDRLPVIGMSPVVGEATDALRHFMFARVYKVLADTESSRRARMVVRGLYHRLLAHRELLPPEYPGYNDEPTRRVVDYIAGMTDLYALRLAEQLGI
ncbi:MAG: deoxyguanosinetriphosphate triphosphohydrolase [Dehalococcoidia bacterium]|nr:deoxyguanosinetriphosphate triphosphohydrolase [Dehalococcoidia bacterium]